MKDVEEIARGVAYIVGPGSAAAQALELMDKLRREGKKAWIEQHGFAWFVGTEEPESLDSLEEL